jgi:hypothetical protein
VSGVCLFLWVAGSSHLKKLATEQRANMKCCVSLHKSPSEAVQMLEEVYDKVTIKKIQVYNWHKSFCDDHASVNDDLRCRQSSTSTNDENIEPLHNIVQSD